MFEKINSLINSFAASNISAARKDVLLPLVSYIQKKIENKETISLNFICTHNSRRSHLSQLWAQTLAFHFGVKDVFCYSGGTEVTAMFPKVAETLSNQGFQIQKLCDTQNPVYAIKFDPDGAPVICFSKTYDDAFNPKNNFAAIMTCQHADEGCPVVFGADARFPVNYEDPKAYDHTSLQNQKYTERSLEIAQEMWWVFRNVGSRL
jgi:arsenate reductase